MEKGEAQTIFDELAESFTLLAKLQRVDGIAIVGLLFGQVLAAAGGVEEALAVLDQSAWAFEKLQMAGEAAKVRELQKKIRGRKK